MTCRLKTTDYLWPNYLAAVEASIIPRNRSSDFSLMPVGSGPFKLTRRSEYRLTLSAFEDYYRERALLDEIDLWVIAAAEETSEFDLHFGYCCEPLCDTEHDCADSGGLHAYHMQSLTGLCSRRLLNDWR